MVQASGLRVAAIVRTIAAVVFPIVEVVLLGAAVVWAIATAIFRGAAPRNMGYTLLRTQGEAEGAPSVLAERAVRVVKTTDFANSRDDDICERKCCRMISRAVFRGYFHEFC